MLKYELTHPPLIEALARAGHGDRLLIADGNYPSLTNTAPGARLIQLNVAPDLLTTTSLLRTLLTAVNPERAVMMRAPEPAAVQDEYREILGPAVPVEDVERFDFYAMARSRDVGVVVTTGDTRPYGNLLITIGLR